MIDEDYEIVSVEPADPPRGMVGTGWHCYIIGQGKNTIRGYQRGSRKAVAESAQEIVMRLNERRYGKRGRVHLVMTAQGKKTQSK